MLRLRKTKKGWSISGDTESIVQLLEDATQGSVMEQNNNVPPHSSEWFEHQDYQIALATWIAHIEDHSNEGE